jgi:hypothetical protein
MKAISLLLISTGLSLTLPAAAPPLPGNPLAGLERLKDFGTRRVSSSDPN